MKIDQFPKDIQDHILPKPEGEMVYRCLGCKTEYSSDRLLDTCPECGSVFLLHDMNKQHINKVSGEKWRRIFDYRKMINEKALKGIFRFYEFVAPIIPLDQIVYLGEGHTPLVEANTRMKNRVGIDFYFKNDGLNPSASFKDRGMACALSYINYLAKQEGMKDVLAICASTGDTSASAALYGSYLDDFLKSAVLLPKGKVTAQQLSQPLGSGAKVLEIPGVFDDCMKVVEFLSSNYHVALLNSKNSWRILGQETFSYEIAQDFDYEVSNKVIFVPIGNAGNITAVMRGFLKFYDAGVIDTLPKIIGVQSEHADPVYRYYLEPDEDKRRFVPVTVAPSVAQAAMIGNPVSMPRVIELVRLYNSTADEKKVFVVQVTEQEIMDSMIIANRNGNIACTQGGESLAGLKKAAETGLIKSGEAGVLDSTAHSLKFAVFQEMYFNNTFSPEFHVRPKPELKNAPIQVRPQRLSKFPEQGKPLTGDDMDLFVREMAAEIASILDLKKK
ncbi:Threonine synthase [uncultured Desulfobacterium sp.]|uniref:Threonine synthase n=1 Tax=uncultured Desulfobacterium sp. TaxID=201089 RepID=A0A445MZ21_9BACT|nr:Threonine synthase [uncultured Desulfobacterium sp.]